MIRNISTATPQGNAWMVVKRPQNRWDSVGVHLPAVLISGAILIASAIRPATGLPLAPTCLFLRLTGYPCPFCGSTRTFIAMCHGHWHDAWHQSPLAAVLFVTIAAIFAWNVVALAAGLVVKPGVRWRLDKRQRLWLAGVFSAILAANWLYRIIAGLR